MDKKKLIYDYQNDCGDSFETTNNSNDLGCDCGPSCGSSVSLNSGKSTLKSKIRTFLFYTIIIAAIVIATISILS